MASEITLAQLVAAIQSAGRKGANDDGLVTVKELARATGEDQKTVRQWLEIALDAGSVVGVETRRESKIDRRIYRVMGFRLAA